MGEERVFLLRYPNSLWLSAVMDFVDVKLSLLTQEHRGPVMLLNNNLFEEKFHLV